VWAVGPKVAFSELRGEVSRAKVVDCLSQH
jgi:hypothetical protein